MCPKGSQDKGLKLLPETSLGAFYTVAMNNKTFSLKLSDTMNSKVVEHFNLATFYPNTNSIFSLELSERHVGKRDILSDSIHYTLLKNNIPIQLTNHKYSNNNMCISSQSFIRNFPLSI